MSETKKSVQTGATRIGEIICSVTAVLISFALITMLGTIPYLIRQGKRKRGELDITIV